MADAAPDQASSWTLAAGSFWAARANLLAGNPQKFAPFLKRAALHGRTFHGLIAQKALGITSYLDENKVRDLGLELGFVDVKVAAVDDTWSGLKFVRRLADRT